jgi:hypothetical protein
MRAVEVWLAEAGLSKYSPAFAGVDEGSFLELMMQVRLRVGRACCANRS